MSAFELRDATVSYDGNTVLNRITLQIERGERVALVGRSGVGKSTLLHLLYEQSRATSALVPQDPGLVRSLSVFHNVFMGRLNQNSVWYNLTNLVMPRHQEVDDIRALLVSLEMDDKLFQPAGELSGGQQQRTSVARALYRKGEALLADEPVSSVDEHQSQSVLRSINSAYDT
ncbi:MAG: ATP-binding cassette domain-containing protein, partial [Rhodospirillaceae bacterium]|nr:ATP-binding cassette domain-containing protein [Rhodospirillaceae bacterium]